MSNTYAILKGDVVEQLDQLEDNSIDLIATDPPYNLGMDEWDKWESNQEFSDWCHQWGTQAYRVLKPQGTIFSFSSNRTYHWMAVALERAGFKTRDMIEWVYWGTMPKGKSLKSCHEPIYVGSKRSHAAFNIETNRIAPDKKTRSALESVILPRMPEGKHPGRKAYDGSTSSKKYGTAIDNKPYQMNEAGRHPYNVVTTTMVVSNEEVTHPANVLDIKKPRGQESIKGHQTQKPVALMQWLITLASSPGDVVLDCFGGTGTTGEAALTTNRDIVLIEKEDQYVKIIRDRLSQFGTDVASLKNR